MKKTAVIYWSGTGNTEAMAEAVAEGARGAGAEVILWTPGEVNTEALNAIDAVAMGCPAMGSEVLEETEFQPMYDCVKGSLTGKAVRCSAPTAGATANGCANGRLTARTPASALSARV